MKKLAWSLDHDWLTLAKEKIRDQPVVSFDVFDTALTRTFDSPHDVWAKVEACALVLDPKYKGYALHREQAETQARRRALDNGREDVTFEDILNEVDSSRYDRARVADLEIEIELQCLHSVPDIHALYTYAVEQDKTVIFVSDMYLPEHVIELALRQNGYTEYAHLYVSGPIGLTKYRGTIWPMVIQRFGPYVVHVGDNSWSDVHVPPMFGIDVLRYERALCSSRTGTELRASVSRASQWIRGTELTYRAHPQGELSWMHLGISLGGPLLLGFTTWIAEQVEVLKPQRLYFVAREGQVFKKSWDVFDRDVTDHPVESRYLYASRATVCLAAGWIESTPGMLSLELLKLLTHSDHRTKARDILASYGLDNCGPLLKGLSSLGVDLNVPLRDQDQGPDRFRQGLLRNSIAIYGALRGTVMKTVAYLRQEGLFDPEIRSVLVDSGWSGSIQRAVAVIRRYQGVTESPLHGLYLALWPSAQANIYSTGPMRGWMSSGFDSPRKNPGLSLGVGIIEELLTADHGTTTGYEMKDHKWVPVLKDDLRGLLEYASKIVDFRIGAFKFLELNDGRKWSTDECRALIDLIMVSPSPQELKLLGSVSHSMLPGHDHSQTLTCPWPGSIEAAEHRLQFSDWHSGLILHWYRTVPEDQRPAVRELARTRLSGYLSARQLTQWGIN